MRHLVFIAAIILRTFNNNNLVFRLEITVVNGTALMQPHRLEEYNWNLERK